MTNFRSSRKRRPGRYIILGALIVGLLWLMKACLSGNGQAPQKRADLFFQQAARNPQQAYSRMAEEYQLLVDEVTFQQLLKNLDLADSAGLTWTDSRIDGSKAHLKGRLNRPHRAPDILEVTMIKKDRRWRMLRFEYAGSQNPPAAISDAPAPQSPPAGPEAAVGPVNRNNEEMIALVRRHLQFLARALETDDFSAFYQLTAGLWRAQTSPAKLRSAYAALKPHAKTILELAGAGQFEIASITPEASAGGGPVIINVNGKTAKGDRQLRFTLKLVFERNGWFMVGLETALY